MYTYDTILHLTITTFLQINRMIHEKKCISSNNIRAFISNLLFPQHLNKIKRKQLSFFIKTIIKLSNFFLHFNKMITIRQNVQTKKLIKKQTKNHSSPTKTCLRFIAGYNYVTHSYQFNYQKKFNSKNLNYSKIKYYENDKVHDQAKKKNKLS